MLKPAAKDDARFFFSLYMHPAINPYLLYDPMTEDEFQPVYDDLLEKGVLYIFRADGQDVGMCKLVPQFHRNAHSLYLGGVAIHPDYAGKGYGLKMMEEIISLAREKDLKRIELSTAVHNSVAIRLYERAGFAIEGRMRNYTWLKNENRLVDEYLMSWIA